MYRYLYMYNNIVVYSMEIDLIAAFVNIIVKGKRVKRTMIKLSIVYIIEKKESLLINIYHVVKIDSRAQSNECV